MFMISYPPYFFYMAGVSIAPDGYQRECDLVVYSLFSLHKIVSGGSDDKAINLI